MTTIHGVKLETLTRIEVLMLLPSVVSSNVTIFFVSRLFFVRRPRIALLRNTIACRLADCRQKRFFENRVKLMTLKLVFTAFLLHVQQYKRN